MLNRHGLVAGATGTGKTKTLQLLAEQLSAAGVPVFAADIKGDLSGLSVPGAENPKVVERADVGRPDLEGHRLPGGVLRPRRPGHRDPAARDDVRLRADAARQGARPQRHPGVLAGAGLPLRRPGRAAAARPRRPARGGQVPRLRRGQGRPQGPRRSLVGDGRGDPARADRLLRPGRRRVLRRARVRHPRPAADDARRPRPDLPGRAAQPPGPAGAVLHLPDVAAGRPVPRPARGRRPRQAQAGVLLRRGPPALRRRVEGVPRRDRPDGAADPVEGRRRLLRDPVADRRTRRRARPARLPHPAPAPRGDARTTPRRSSRR